MKESIGALWIKTAKSGIKFYSGNIKVNGQIIKIVGFDNKKTKETQPDIQFYISEDRNDAGSDKVVF